VDAFPNERWQVSEYRDDAREGVDLRLVRGEIGVNRCDLHVPLARQALRFAEAVDGEVQGGDLMSEPGEEDRVSSFALGEAQDLGRGWVPAVRDRR
jgi:hypothetical protein